MKPPAFVAEKDGSCTYNAYLDPENPEKSTEITEPALCGFN